MEAEIGKGGIWMRFSALPSIGLLCINPVCLPLGAAGFAVLSYGVIGTKPSTDARAWLYRGPATRLIVIGAAFFLGISFFAEWFVR